MMSFEDFEGLINKIKDSLDETTSALLSEDLLSIVSNYKIGLDKIEEISKDLEKIKSDKDELLKVNGKLFQQIGFDKPEENDVTPLEDEEDEVKIEDVIDEKGELI